MAETPQTQLLNPPKGVDVVAIERELLQLWKEAGGDFDGESSHPVMRACSLNFVIVTEDPAEVETIANMVGEVTVEHPSRIFLISTDRASAKPELDAWISARCTLPVPGGKQVCCEQINLTASGVEANKIPSVVTSLLVPDVLTVLLWRAKVDQHDSILRSLVQVADRVLVDSSGNHAPEASLFAWREFVKNQAGRSSFGDLAWTHLTPWRTLIANAFNPADLRDQLRTIHTIEMTYSSTSSPKHTGLSQALMLVGWLSSRLRWILIHPLERKGVGGFEAKLRSDEQAINVSIAPVDARSGMPGGVESVRVETLDTSLCWKTTRHTDCIDFERRQGESVSHEIMSMMTDQSEALLVSAELEVLQRDTLYESSLDTLAHLLNDRK